MSHTATVVFGRQQHRRGSESSLAESTSPDSAKKKIFSVLSVSPWLKDECTTRHAQSVARDAEITGKRFKTADHIASTWLERH